MDTVGCLGHYFWLFSPAWDTVEFTLKDGFKLAFNYLFVVIDWNPFILLLSLTDPSNFRSNNYCCHALSTCPKLRMPTFLSMVIIVITLMCVYYCVSGYDTCMSCCWVGQCLAPAKQCMKSLVSTLVSPHSACSMRLMFIPPFPTSAQDEAPQPMPVVCAPLAGHSLSLSLSLCLSLSVSLSLSLSLSLYPV